MTLPDRGWASYEAAMHRLGEGRSDAGDQRLLRLLSELDLVEPGLDQLTEQGRRYFDARFIRGEDDAARAILHVAVLNYPPAAAVSQLLAGVASANRKHAETVLRSRGFQAGLTDRSLASLLTLMDAAGVITYRKNDGSLRVLDSAARHDTLPKSVFISPKTPFGNKVWLRRVLEECNQYIHWLDKHFMPVAVEAVWEAADASHVNEVKILSLRLKDHEGRRPLRSYRDLVAELRGRGIAFEWRVIDSAQIKDTHDRWIISAGTARNVPNVNAIYTGQHSELNLSDQRAELEALFERYWSDSQPFDVGVSGNEA